MKNPKYIKEFEIITEAISFGIRLSKDFSEDFIFSFNRLNKECFSPPKKDINREICAEICKEYLKTLKK